MKKTEHHVMIKLQFGKKDQYFEQVVWLFIFWNIKKNLGTFERGAEQVVICLIWKFVNVLD